MTTSCIAFFSKAGIVAASDSDFSIRPMSKNSPVAMAVNTLTPIPWKTIIDEYLLENENRSFSSVNKFFESFKEYFIEKKISSSIFKKDQQEHIFLMGFNDEDIYPTLLVSKIEVSEDSYLYFSEFYERNVCHEDSAFFAVIGDFNFVSPILAGATDPFMEIVSKNEIKLLNRYKDKLLEKVKGMPQEKEWNEKIENFNVKDAVEENITSAVQEILNEVDKGIDTFSIQEMVDYAESLVNAELRLRSLKHKEKEITLGTREISVITIPEGLTWIKHHLFAI